MKTDKPNNACECVPTLGKLVLVFYLLSELSVTLCTIDTSSTYLHLNVWEANQIIINKRLEMSSFRKLTTSFGMVSMLESVP